MDIDAIREHFVAQLGADVSVEIAADGAVTIHRRDPLAPEFVAGALDAFAARFGEAAVPERVYVTHPNKLGGIHRRRIDRNLPRAVA